MAEVAAGFLSPFYFLLSYLFSEFFPVNGRAGRRRAGDSALLFLFFFFFPPCGWTVPCLFFHSKKRSAE